MSVLSKFMERIDIIDGYVSKNKLSLTLLLICGSVLYNERNRNKRGGMIDEPTIWQQFKKLIGATLTDRGLAWVGLATGMFGIIGDSFHAKSSVLGYPDPHVFGLLAWWVPAEFALGGLVLGLLYPRIYRFLNRVFKDPMSLPSWGRTIVCALGALGVYLASSILNWLHVPDWLISVFLCGSTMGLWALSGRSLTVLSTSTILGAFGLMFESTLCRLGLFFYKRPDMLMVRHWIFWLWTAAIIAAGPAILKLERDGRRASSWEQIQAFWRAPHEESASDSAPSAADPKLGSPQGTDVLYDDSTEVKQQPASTNSVSPSSSSNNLPAGVKRTPSLNGTASTSSIAPLLSPAKRVPRSS